MAKKSTKMSQFVELNKQGLSVREIATRLKLSRATVYSYRNRTKKNCAEVKASGPFAELSALITRLGVERLQEMLRG